MKKVLLYLLFTILLSSCGYTMIGFNSDKPVYYYINPVNNNTIDSNLTEIVQLEAERFFINYNELASYQRATYFMDIYINNLNYVNPVLTPTDEATSTSVAFDLLIVITDVEGKEIFSWNKNISQQFTISTTISSALKNREKAIIDALEDALISFRLSAGSKLYTG